MAASLILLVSVSLAAHAAAVQSSVDAAGGSYLRAADYRVASVVHRIAERGGAHCPASHPLTGLLLHHLSEYAGADHAEAVRRFGIDKGPGVLAVVPGSAAARAGVAAGDLLLAVNGVKMPRPLSQPGRTAGRGPRRDADAADRIIEEQAASGRLELQLLRGGRMMHLALTPTRGCAARGRLARSDQANAFADGRYAIMTTKMLDFVRSDDELAVVMAHEVAHNLLGHPARLEAQKVPHGILRNLGKNAARVRTTEEEADRLAIKLVWAAGYDVSAAIPFWRRLYGRYDPIPTPKIFSTHPSLGARERMIRETIAELTASSGKGG